MSTISIKENPSFLQFIKSSISQPLLPFSTLAAVGIKASEVLSKGLPSSSERALIIVLFANPLEVRRSFINRIIACWGFSTRGNSGILGVT